MQRIMQLKPKAAPSADTAPKTAAAKRKSKEDTKESTSGPLKKTKMYEFYIFTSITIRFSGKPKKTAQSAATAPPPEEVADPNNYIAPVATTTIRKSQHNTRLLPTVAEFRQFQYDLSEKTYSIVASEDTSSTLEESDAIVHDSTAALRMLYYLQTGAQLLLYGYGSRRDILDHFALTYLQDEDVLAVSPCSYDMSATRASRDPLLQLMSIIASSILKRSIAMDDPCGVQEVVGKSAVC